MRSPRFTPSFLSTLANLFTSRQTSRYVSTRSSPGSPSQMIAALLPRPFERCRSMQLYDAFSLPPINHFAHGVSHSRTFFQGLNHSSSFAACAQNPFGSFFALAKNPGLRMFADFLNDFGGGKLLFSCNRTSIGLSAMARPPRLGENLVLFIKRSGYYATAPRLTSGRS